MIGKPGIRTAGSIERDLSDGTIPYLSESWIEAAYTPEAQRTAEYSVICWRSQTR